MITGIILASGFSRRMGEDKLLIDLKGESIVERVIKACVNSELDRLIIIYRKEEIKDIAGEFHIECLFNRRADLGQAEAIKLGIRSAENKSDFMFIMGDQPFIDSNILDRLIKEYRRTDKNILVPYYNGNRSSPSIIGYKYKDELLKLEGDRGGRELIEKYSEDVEVVEIEDGRAGIDIDSPEDLERVKKWI